MAGWNRWGYYRYGRSVYRPDDRTRDRRDAEEGPTGEELFGAGVALRSGDDEEGLAWDFMADATGDLGATVGSDELRKDLAFATAREATSLVGTLNTANDRSRLASDIEEIAARDSRVTSVSADPVVDPRGRPMTSIEIDVDADTRDLPRMVFPLQD